MTRTEELMKLAEAAIANPVAFSMRDGHTHVDMGRAIKQELFKQAADPETIKQLVELCRLQHEALELASMRLESALVENAITAFERFEKGGE